MLGPPDESKWKKMFLEICVTASPVDWLSIEEREGMMLNIISGLQIIVVLLIILIQLNSCVFPIFCVVFCCFFFLIYILCFVKVLLFPNFCNLQESEEYNFLHWDHQPRLLVKMLISDSFCIFYLYFLNYKVIVRFLGIVICSLCRETKRSRSHHFRT